MPRTGTSSSSGSRSGGSPSGGSVSGPQSSNPGRSANQGRWDTRSDPRPKAQSAGHRAILCGVVGAVNRLTAWGQQLTPEQIRVAIGVGLILTSLATTQGAAAVPILLGAGFGSIFGYGREVWDNRQDGLSWWDSLTTDIDWENVGYAAFAGAVSGSVAAMVTAVLPAVGAGVGLGWTVAAVAGTELISGRLEQIAVNVVSGRYWSEDVLNPTWFDIGLDLIPGVGATLFKPALRGIGRAAKRVGTVSIRATNRITDIAGRIGRGGSSATLDPNIQSRLFEYVDRTVTDRVLRRLDKYASRSASVGELDTATRHRLAKYAATNGDSAPLLRRALKNGNLLKSYEGVVQHLEPNGKPRVRVVEPIPGLYESIPDTPEGWPKGWRIEEFMADTQGSSRLAVAKPQIIDANGNVVSEGVFQRFYNVNEARLTFKAGYLGNPNAAKNISDLPDWIDLGIPLVEGLGTRTNIAMTLYQMRRMGVPYGSLKKAYMSEIVNIKTIAHLAWLKHNFPNRSISELVTKTPSVRYAETILIQSGHRIIPGSFTIVVPKGGCELYLAC